MRKLEKQMKKIGDLKQDAFVFNFDKDEVFQPRELKKLRELEFVHQNMAKNQKYMFKKEYEMDMLKEHQNHALEQSKEAIERSRRAIELQRHQLEKVREHYPDGFELPEMEFDLEDLNIEIPEMHFEMPDFPMELRGFYGGDEADNNLSIHKTLDNESVEKDLTYTVADDAMQIDLKVNGSVDTGEVKIVLKTPDGKEYQTVELNASADVSWSQKMKLSGENKEQYKGKWTISVKGDDVKGHYSIYMRSK